LCNQVAEALAAALAPIRSLDVTQTEKRPASICCQSQTINRNTKIGTHRFSAALTAFTERNADRLESG